MAIPRVGWEGQHLGEEVSKGMKGRNAYGLCWHFKVWGKGLPLKGCIGPGDYCRGGLEQWRHWVLLEKPGLWSWTFSKLFSASPQILAGWYWHGSQH